jgi:hypothetical protein
MLEKNGCTFVTSKPTYLRDRPAEQALLLKNDESEIDRLGNT